MNLNFKFYLNEGLIKLPEKAFKEGQTKIVSDLASFLVTELSSVKHAEVKKVIDHVKSVASKHAAQVRHLVKKTHSKFKLEISKEDLPEKYRKLGPEVLGKVELDLDWKVKGRLVKHKASGLYDDSNDGKVIIGIAKFIDSDWKKKAVEYVMKADKGFESRIKLSDVLIDEFDALLEQILGTFEHELTHYVQFKILRAAHEKQIGGLGKSHAKDNQKDEYYNSQVEFDPQIKSAIAKFHRMEKDNLDAKMDGNRRLWIDIFVGAKKIPRPAKPSFLDIVSNEKYGGFVKPSDFFLSLKKVSENRWKKAIKLFTQELQKRYPE